MKYLLLLIPFQLFGQSWTTEIKDWDFENRANIKIQYVDSIEWAHMPQGGSWNKVKDTYLEYAFTGYEIHVHTERAGHHGGYIVSLDHIDVDTVTTNNEHFIKDYRTFFKQWPVQGNHIIKLRPMDERPFVLDKFVTFTNSDPDYGIVWDTLRIPVYDTLIVPIDSTVYNYEDSLTYKDTLIVHEKDTLIYTYINCPSSGEKENPWLLWIIGGLAISTSLFVILYITK